jgi:dipeptidyl-peptidase-4
MTEEYAEDLPMRPARTLVSCCLAAVAAVVAIAPAATGQSRIRNMPGYDQWAEMSPRITGAVKQGSVTVEWAEDSGSFEYTLDGKRWRFDVRNRTVMEPPRGIQPAPAPGPSAAPAAPAGGLVLARGRGRDADVLSPDGKTRAISRDRNIWLVSTDGSGAEVQLTTDGSEAARIRHGVGSYVYLEEFSVSQPVWWSPDGGRLAWMRYDEREVDDYFLQLDQTQTQSTMLVQAYPHPGAKNPAADLVVHDVATGKSVTMDVRDGAAFSDDVIGHYVWAAQWTKDGSEVLVRRADRLQKHYDLAACVPATGKCRSVVRETRLGSWASGTAPRFLKDGKRFIWTSERNDFRNFYLYDLSGKLLATLTQHAFEVVDIVRVDEDGGWLWYTARSGDNHMKVQLHRVRLDGTGDRRLTDPALTHRVAMSPDGRYFVDVEQAHDRPPVTRVRDIDGRMIAQLASSDTVLFDALKLKQAELFTFTSADGATQLHGMLQFPSNFDPAKSYPMLVSVYGGPGSNGLTEAFATPNPLAEYGFLILRVDARTNAGKGRRILDTSYKQLGVVEMDDIAAGIRATWNRPYVDRTRVGIYGTSYGGTVAATVLMRHPDVVQAAAASSPVTDYRLYDTAYTERFLGLPDADPAAYDRAAVLTYADKLEGDLMIYYGTSDDNVHPKNALQLIKALQDARKSFEVQVGPDRGHTGIDQTRMMEFFIERLILDKDRQLGAPPAAP